MKTSVSCKTCVWSKSCSEHKENTLYICSHFGSLKKPFREEPRKSFYEKLDELFNLYATSNGVQYEESR